MKIYVVVIGRGAYSDRDEWPEIAFSLKGDAEGFIATHRVEDREKKQQYFLKQYGSPPSLRDYYDYRIDEIGLDEQIEYVRGDEK